jgi:hypothetical protein
MTMPGVVEGREIKGQKLTAEERSAIAKKGAEARWKKS